MKKLILLLFIPLVTFGQGEQLYADGTANDQDGNTFEWISYGEQDWSTENAEVVTYRDGTPIPQVTDDEEWSNLTTGAWCYYENNPNLGKLYNWYAVAGIHDNDVTTPNKQLAPQGWHIPTADEWGTLRFYLIQNGYNYDGTTSEDKIAKSLASTTGWNLSDNVGAPGNDQSTNNSSGFNAFPVGGRVNDTAVGDGAFGYAGLITLFWSSTEIQGPVAQGGGYLFYNYPFFSGLSDTKNEGYSIRFVRNTSTASLNDYTNSINIFPNPSSQYINVNIDSELEAVVFDLLGKELIREKITGRLDISSLEKGTYILNLTDGVNTSIHKIIKD